MQYEWRAGYRARGLDPQLVGEAVEKLEATHGHVTPDIVLAEAQKKRSVFHAAFEWNDVSAAIEYRRWQARSLLNSLVVVYERAGEPHRVRAFFHVTNGESSYSGVATVMDDAALRQQVVQRALRELNAWRERYKEYEELAEACRAIDALEVLSLAA